MRGTLKLMIVEVSLEVSLLVYFNKSITLVLYSYVRKFDIS